MPSMPASSRRRSIVPDTRSPKNTRRFEKRDSLLRYYGTSRSEASHPDAYDTHERVNNAKKYDNCLERTALADKQHANDQ